MNILLLQEFITMGGAKIKGGTPINQANSMTMSNSTTDDMANTKMQGISRYNQYGRFRYMGEEDESGEDAKLPKKDKEKKYPRVKKSVEKKIEENSKKKIDKIIEDVFTKKDFDRDFVTKQSDLRLNGIQPLDTIKDSNPILIRKVQTLKELIEKNDATGEEKAIILNYLLDMDMTDIPNEYKNELKKKIR
jgi:hypothetical protein